MIVPFTFMIVSCILLFIDHLFDCDPRDGGGEDSFSTLCPSSPGCTQMLVHFLGILLVYLKHKH